MNVYIVISAVCDSGEIVLGCFTDRAKASAMATEQQSRRRWESISVVEAELDSLAHINDEFRDYKGWPSI